jgi:Spy/CpxP family protein refolding chaperone
MIRFCNSLAAAAMLTSVAALGIAPAMAQTAPAKPGPAQSEMRHHVRLMPGQFIDGRIAFLKAELKITPAQEKDWQQLAAAMRQNATALDQAIANAHQRKGASNAVDRLATREQFARMRADNDARLLAALKPLYASLTPEQQQTANLLIGAGHGRHHGGWHHRA